MKRVHAKGFSLVEVLVALIIIAVGLLGLAKLQAVVYASTGNASQKSLAAIEAASLSAAMRANRNYWSALPAALTVTMASVALPSPATVTATGDSVLSTALTTTAPATATTQPSYCLFGQPNAPCTAPSTLAAYDLNVWANALEVLLPGASASVACSALTATVPVTCTIQVNWVEHTVAANTQSQGLTLAAPTYTLYVVP